MTLEPDRATDSILVRVDDRERASGTVEALRALAGIEVEIQHLPVGDYEVDGQLLFERKTLLDFAESIKDGRLFRQVSRLAAAPVRGVLILEGTSAELARSAMTRESIQGALVCATILYGLPILRSLSPEETARLMVYAARQVRAVACGALPRAGARPKGKRKRQLHILQGLPHIGPARAARLLEAFGSVEAVFRAPAQDLQMVPDIGPHTAEAIRWALGESEAHYLPAASDDPSL